MGQSDRGLRILVIDSDPAFQAELQSRGIIGAQISFLAHANAPRVRVPQADIIVVSVDSPAGLSLVAGLCARPATPPVIAIGGACFDGKSLEQVLLLAELRGAALSLPKPLEASELVIAAISLAHARRLQQDNTPIASPRASRRPAIPPDAA